MFIILVAHIPWNPWTEWIPARFGFSDAAKAMEHGAAPEAAAPQDFLRGAVNPEKSAFSEAAMWPWQMMQQMREQMQHTAEAAAQAAADAAAQASDDATPATKSRRSKK